MNPKISIITITYNSERTLENTIQSVIQQQYNNLEYIIIDGGSTDSTLNIVNKYKKHISYSVSEPDKGISDAFNKGISAATGDVIGIINSDDLLLSGALKTIADSYDEITDVYLGNLLVNDTIRDLQVVSVPSLEYKIQSRKTTVCHPSTFIAKKAYQKFGLYRVDFRYMMDQDLLTRVYVGGGVFKRVDAILAQFNCGGVTDHVNFKKSLSEYVRMIRLNGGSRFLAFSLGIRAFFYKVIKELCVSIGLWDWLRSKKYNKNSK